jgi:hypothetical protein
VQELAREIEAIQRVMEEVGPRVEQFEEEAIFSNDPEYITQLDPITSAKLGELEHAVIEQIELIDSKIQTGFRYTSCSARRCSTSTTPSAPASRRLTTARSDPASRNRPSAPYFIGGWSRSLSHQYLFALNFIGNE